MLFSIRFHCFYFTAERAVLQRKSMKLKKKSNRRETADVALERERIMKKEKNYKPLIAGAVLLIVGIVLALYTHHTSYQESLTVGTELKEVTAAIKDLEAGTGTGDLEALKASKAALTDQKLSLERPYSYSLALVFFSILLTLKGLYNALFAAAPAPKAGIKRLAQAGLLAALCYIGFAFFKIDIPVGAEKTAFHFGNVFCVLAALLVGGFWGGLAGAVGMTIGDLTTTYVTSAPKTFVLKLFIGLIVGFVAHNIFKLDRDNHSKAYVARVTVFASFCGMAFNVVADPLVGYFYKTYLLGVPQDLAKALAKISALTTSVNAVVAVICASIFYLALRPALKKAGLFVQVIPETAREAKECETKEKENTKGNDRKDKGTENR